jgi:hypothetical protein
MNSRMQQRRAHLLKLAKKKEGLSSGKFSRKDVEKALGKAKNIYNALRSKVEEGERHLSEMEQCLTSDKQCMQDSRSEILRAHDILQTMDFSNASAAKVHKDTGDIAYAVDGKWKYVDKNDMSMTPFSDWKKKKVVEEQNAKDTDKEDEDEDDEDEDEDDEEDEEDEEEDEDDNDLNLEGFESQIKR